MGDTRPPHRPNEESDSDLMDGRDQVRNLRSNDMDCKDIYEGICYTEFISPYANAGMRKMQWADFQVKENCSRLKSMSSAKKNVKHLILSVEDTERKTHLGNLPSFTQTCLKAHTFVATRELGYTGIEFRRMRDF